MSKPVTMFAFYGRRENMELQLPFITRILDQHPNVTFHAWNLSRNQQDSDYIKSLKGTHKHLEVRNDFADGKSPWAHFDDVYRVYANPIYAGTVFVKLDDDVVFIETDRFGDFVNEIGPGTLLSAKVVNNGACGVHFLDISRFHHKMNINLLDVHLHGKYAKMCHNAFLLDPDHYLAEPWMKIPTVDWLSINFIGYDYGTALEFAQKLGTPSPHRIAGRRFRPNATLGDEGLANTFQRSIMQGFTVAHLTFGPQERKVNHRQWTEFRAQYAIVGKEYLG